jgi:hypothetical protein
MDTIVKMIYLNMLYSGVFFNTSKDKVAELCQSHVDSLPKHKKHKGQTGITGNRWP